MTDTDRHYLGRELLKQVSRSFYLSLVLLPKPMREPLSLGYLLARASDTIADAARIDAAERRDLLGRFRQGVTEWVKPDPLEQIRSRLRSPGVLEHEGERALIERLPDCLEWLAGLPDDFLRAAIVEVLEVITDGQRWDIERFEIGEESDAGPDSLSFCETAEELETTPTRWPAAWGNSGPGWVSAAASTLPGPNSARNC